MFRWWIAKRRAAGWKALREQYGPQTLQAFIRRAERCGDFKFLRRSLGVTLLRRRRDHKNTWDFIESFATKWAARNFAANMVRQSDGVLQ